MNVRFCLSLSLNLNVIDSDCWNEGSRGGGEVHDLRN